MMHYGSWLYPGVLDNHQYYNRYTEESPVYQNRAEARDDENSEQTGDETHETMTSATSCDRSTGADIFRLEFAAAQWSKLVSNAEGLFNKLMINNLLPHNEQDQIEQWLCLKQEYEECIASDETASLQGYQENARRSLERIEEVTETDEKTDESANRAKLRETACSSGATSEMSEEEDEDLQDSEDEEEEEEVDDDDDDDDDEDDEDRSDGGSENPDFLEKLDDLMNKFKRETDRLIDAKKYEFHRANIVTVPTITKIPNSSNNNNNNNNNDYVPIIKPIPIRNPNSRRHSMLPGSEMCNEVITFNGSFRPCRNKNNETGGSIGEPGKSNNEETPAVRKENSSTDVPHNGAKASEIPEPMRTLKTLAANNEAKQSLVNKIQSDLENAQKRIIELQSTIRTKERFIEDMNKNSEVRSCAKEKFQRKRNKLEEEYYNTRSQLAQAENATMYETSDEKSQAAKRDIQRYKTMAIHYEKRLMDIEMMKQIAGDSAKKVLELESSLNSSRRQMEKLKKQLKREEERKRQLEHELAEDQKKIRHLEEKYNLTASKLRVMQQSESEDERIMATGRDKRLDEEDKKDEEDEEDKEDDRCDEKKNLLEVSARISHLDQVLKEKSMNLERMTDTDEKEALRHEIRNLRRTRECLIEEKCGLDKKLQKERTLTMLEERKLLECGETIEAIDAMIEHKNEMICGRVDFDVRQSQREKSERMLSQLEKLSDGEMRTLFDKYFWKVIDLKQSSKNLEIQTAELERHVESQDRRMAGLTEALRRTKLEAERKIVQLQREQQERLHLIFRHIAEETGSSGHERLDRNVQLARFRRENKILKRRLADVEALLKPATTATTTTRKNVVSPPRIVQQELKKIPPKTKVTRERNKLIIQQTIDSDKRNK